jgi:hypothetical protein
VSIPDTSSVTSEAASDKPEHTELEAERKAKCDHSAALSNKGIRSTTKARTLKEELLNLGHGPTELAIPRSNYGMLIFTKQIHF